MIRKIAYIIILLAIYGIIRLPSDLWHLYLSQTQDNTPRVEQVKSKEPSPEATPSATPTHQPTPTATPKKVSVPTVPSSRWEGTASYYSRTGCVGCSKTLTMANGEPLNDAAYTVAFNRVALNQTVKVKNKKTLEVVEAKVTDRGGFERLGRIIDLSVATKLAINCSDLCDVEVWTE